MSTPTTLDRTLAQPITLTRGLRSHVVTLMDAAILIRDLDPLWQARPLWDRAAEMILLAAESNKRADVAEATRQLIVCVERENWWKSGDQTNGRSEGSSRMAARCAPHRPGRS